jgi:hypothetical protein
LQEIDQVSVIRHLAAVEIDVRQPDGMRRTMEA